MTINRVWAMPNRNTFSIPPIRDWIIKHIPYETKVVIDPFANNSDKVIVGAITNDLNPDYDTDYHMDALDFLRLFNDNSVDAVRYDPPYSPRQVSECYKSFGYEVTNKTTQSSFWSQHKWEISRIVKTGGIVLSFGWNTNGMGKRYGFEIVDVLIVAHGGHHNDTLCTCGTKI